MNVWNIAGVWDFGLMKLSAFYGDMSADGPVAGVNREVGRENWSVGVIAPLRQWNFRASYSVTNGKDELDNVDASQWAVGVDYNLSKRTALYAAWASINNDNGARFVISTQSALPAAGVNFDSTGGQIGIRHSF